MFIYSGFYVAFNTVQVISRRVVGRAEETSTYSSSGFCTVNCRPTASNYQLSHLRPCRGTEPRPQRWEARVLPLCHRGPLGLLCEKASLNRYRLNTFAWNEMTEKMAGHKTERGFGLPAWAAKPSEKGVVHWVMRQVLITLCHNS